MLRRKIEVIGELHYRQFEHNEPQPVCEKKARKLAAAPSALPPPKVSSHAGGEREDRQAKVRDPSA